MGSPPKQLFAALCLFLASNAFSAQHSEIAVTARYYYPYPDKRHSYHQVYVVRDDGSKPRQLTFDRGDKKFVRWAGRNCLAYVARHGKSDELWLIDVNTRRKSLVKRAKGLWTTDFCTGDSPGEPVYFVGTRAMVLRAGRLHASNRTDEAPHAKLPLTVPAKNGSPAFTLSTTPAPPGNDSPTLVVTVNGEAHPLPKLSESTFGFLGVIYDARTHRAWAHVVAGESTFGHPEILYALGSTAPYVTEVASGVCLDWSPDHDVYAYIPTRHDAAYGPKKFVWTSEAGIGSMRTGKKKPLVKGFVYVTSISLRPQ